MRALILSAGFHAFLFLVFSLVHVSEGESQTGRKEPSSVSVAQVQKAISASPIVPKPKIKRVDIGSGAENRRLEFDTGERDRPADWEAGFGKFSGEIDEGLLSGDFKSRPLTDFFGSTSNLRKICYVVDASGSMQGRLGMVRRQLKQSISKLQADHYFYIIFFRGDRLVESGNGKLVRATDRAKSRAYKFVDSVRFEGPTNAAKALERAMKIRGSGGESAQQIYFLSDGFDLGKGNSFDFAGMVEKLRNKLAPSVRINTIGIWVEDQDEKILQKIASNSGGEFVGLD